MRQDKGGRNRQGYKSRDGKSGQKPNAGKPCPNCGIRVHRFGTCPAIGKDCNKCGKKGHFKNQCRSNVNAVSREQIREESGDEVKLFE